MNTTSLRVLILNNIYQHLGGEEICTRAEQKILEENGNETRLISADNHQIAGSRETLKAAASAIYSLQARQHVSDEINRFKPHIVHVHNFFPLLSPSVFYACKEAGVPVVQTLHNYRLFCPGVYFFRNGKNCEDCLGKLIPWPGILHGCYRESRPATAAVSAMLTTHRLLGTWANAVDMYIALTEFARKKFIAGGFSPDKLKVKPNFVDPDPGPGETERNYAIFVGRLSPEKGVSTLLEAWKQLRMPVPLQIAGDGPARSELEAQASRLGLTSVSWLGRLSREHIMKAIKGARFLVFPSQWYEGFPQTIGEAFACGTPVICSRMGGMQEIVTDEVLGLHFTPGCATDLAAKVEWAWMHHSETAALGRRARQEYESKYTASRNYDLLMDIYHSVIRGRAQEQLTSTAGVLLNSETNV